jgi:hypothetical protein
VDGVQPSVMVREDRLESGGKASAERFPTSERICLAPFTPRLADSLRRDTLDRGRCWVGDLVDVLAHPRFGFPTDRHYTRVRTTDDGRACALDSEGRLTCCGVTNVSLDGRFKDIDTAGVHLCLVEERGDIQCIDAGTSRRFLTMRGTFERVSASENGACGLRADGHIECAFPARQGSPVPSGAFREANASALCGIRDTGERSDGGEERLGTGAWPQITARREGARTACALNGSGGTWCWSIAAPQSSFHQVQTARPLTRLASGLGSSCGLGRDCEPECWEGPPILRRRWTSCPRDVAIGDPSCFISVAGDLRCDEPETWDDAFARRGD